MKPDGSRLRASRRGVLLMGSALAAGLPGGICLDLWAIGEAVSLARTLRTAAAATHLATHP